MLFCANSVLNDGFFPSTHVLSFSFFVVCFLLGNSPASEFYMPTFRNAVFHLHRCL